jgi:hypothetical protein
MVRVTFVIAAVALAALAAPAAAAERDGEVRHSGTVVEVVDGGRALVLAEMVTWQDPDEPGIVYRSVHVTPDTAIQLIERSEKADGDSLPGWRSESLETGDLRKGDFVTVTTDDDARGRAVSLQVLRPHDQAERS